MGHDTVVTTNREQSKSFRVILGHVNGLKWVKDLSVIDQRIKVDSNVNSIRKGMSWHGRHVDTMYETQLRMILPLKMLAWYELHNGLGKLYGSRLDKESKGSMPVII